MANLKLKEMRKKRKITQIEIAKMLNIGQSTYSTWENNIYQPDIDNLIKLADILDCSVDKLLGRYKD